MKQKLALWFIITGSGLVVIGSAWFVFDSSAPLWLFPALVGLAIVEAMALVAMEAARVTDRYLENFDIARNGHVLDDWDELQKNNPDKERE